LPRFLSSELKKLTPAVERANVCFIAINQLRSDLGAFSPTTVESSPGGRAFKHACSVMVSVKKLTSKDTIIYNAHDEPIGHTIKAKIEKNKVGTPGREATYQVEYLKGNVNQVKELFTLGVRLGVFISETSKTKIISGNRLTSERAALDYLSDPEVYKRELENVVSFYRTNANVELSNDLEDSENEESDDYVDEDDYSPEDEE
jgi:RecA/RadA recombinase